MSNRHATRASLLAAAGLLAVSCTDPRTEIIVVVDTDLDVPTELSSIRVEATNPEGEVREATADPLTRDGLPVSVGLVNEEGPLGPFLIRAIGERGGRVRVERSAQTSFIHEQTLVLELHLLGSCRGVSCGPGETCGEEGCGPVDLDPDELARWSGTLPRIGGDGGVDGGDGGPDGDASCEIMPEQCNGLDDDCDGVIDNGYDFQRNEDHCGSCNHVCSEEHSTTECLQGRCVVTECEDDRWGDCNDSGDDGCETSLETEENCGSCGNECPSGQECRRQRCR